MLIQMTCNSFLNNSDSPRSRSYQSNRKVNQGNGPSESRSSSTTARSKGGNSFKEFLWQHIEMALGRGFDDNVGRNPVPSLFEVCPWSKEDLENKYPSVCFLRSKYECKSTCKADFFHYLVIRMYQHRPGLWWPASSISSILGM